MISFKGKFKDLIKHLESLARLEKLITEKENK